MSTVFWLLLVTSICGFICLVITVLIIYYLYVDKTNSFDIYGRIKLYSLLSSISFTLSCIGQAIFLTDFDERLLMKSSSDPNTLYSILIQINIGLSGVGWAFGEYFLYLLFIIRLYKTYRDSQFKVPNCVYIFLYTPLTLFLISQTLTTLLGLSTYHHEYTHISTDAYSSISELLEHISAAIHFIVSILLLYMFVSRLLKLFIMSGSYSNLTINDSNRQIVFDDNQKSILDLVIKHTILSSTAIISSQIFFNISLVFILSFHNLRNHLSTYKHDATANFIMLPLDCFINCLSMFLSFKFKHKWYLCCCSKYHKCCKWFCSKCVRKKIRRKVVKIQSLLSDENEESLKSRSDTNYDMTSRIIDASLK